jgi:hypothetical protein
MGNGFAMAEARVILATIARRYRLRLTEGRPVEPIGLVTLRAKDGIWMGLQQPGRDRGLPRPVGPSATAPSPSVRSALDR